MLKMLLSRLSSEISFYTFFGGVGYVLAHIANETYWLIKS